MVQDEVVIEEPAPIDFDWCEETSNCGDLILDQDIPATLEEEVVTNSSTEAEDEQQPPHTVTTNVPMSPPATSYPLHHKARTISVSSNPRSLLKVNYLAVRPPSKFRKTLLVNKSLLKSVGSMPSGSNQVVEGVGASSSAAEPKFVLPTVRLLSSSSATGSSKKPPVVAPAAASVSKVPIIEAVKSSRRTVKDAPKFRQTVKLPKKELFKSKKMNYLAKQLQQRNSQQQPPPPQQKPTERISESVPPATSGKSGGGGGKGKRGKKFVDLHGENITINHDVESGSTLDPRRTPVIDVDSRVVSTIFLYLKSAFFKCVRFRYQL